MLFSPHLIWASAQHGVIVSLISGHFLAQPWRSLKFLIFSPQFHFGYDKTFIVSMEHIYFESVFSIWHEVSGLVYYAAFAQGERSKAHHQLGNRRNAETGGCGDGRLWMQTGAAKMEVFCRRIRRTEHAFAQLRDMKPFGDSGMIACANP